MKFEVNISKKHVFFFAIFAVFVLGGVFVYAVAPNPGHDANQIGAGNFFGDDNSIWNFPGKVLAQSTKPVFEFYSLANGNPGSRRWRMILESGILRIDKSNNDNDFQSFFTPLSLNGGSGKVGLESPAGFPGVVEWNSQGKSAFTRLKIIESPQNTGDLSIDLSPADQSNIDLDFQPGLLDVKADIKGKKLYGDEVCIAGDCSNTWAVRLGNLPPGAWCGWGINANDANAVKCTGAAGSFNPAVGCPTVNGVVIFTQVHIGNIGYTCVKNQ